MSTIIPTPKKPSSYAWLAITTIISAALLVIFNLLLPLLPFKFAITIASVLYITAMVGWFMISSAKGYLNKRGGRWKIDDHPAHFLAIIVSFFFVILGFTVPGNLSDRVLYNTVQTRVEVIHDTTGILTPNHKRVDEISSFQQLRENREFLKDLRRSTYSREKTLNFIMAGELLGFDTQYVRQNYMIRPQDYKDMYSHIHENPSLPAEGVALAVKSQ